MSCHGFMPPAINTTATSSEMIDGIRKFRFKLSTEVLRHASSGPTAVSSNNTSAIGTFTLLKNGGPTVIFVPCTASERIGNSVPHNTANADTSSSTLLKRKLDSRETSDSNRCSLFK